MSSPDPHSNTPLPDPALHHSPDPLPMITASLFDPAPRWPQLLSGRASPALAPHSATLAVPASAYGRAGSPLDLPPSNSIHGNGPISDLGAAEHSSTYAPFVLTRSRAVKVRKLPSATFISLGAIFESLGESSGVSVWTLKDLSALDQVWVVFKTHHDACIFLSLSLPSFSTFPALEVELEPFDKLRRVDVLSRFPSLPVIQPESKSHRLRMSISTPDLHNRIYHGHLNAETRVPPSAQTDKFVISSNPPNPRTTFRVGDWICNSVTCAAHNFGRNLACRGCGCPRAESQVSSMNRQALGLPSSRLPTSPRFAGTPGNNMYYTGTPIPSSPNYATSPHGSRLPLVGQPATGPKPASPSHPLLTPSGRSFSVGGKVQNISTDPGAPCIMYWPDNEPFPEQGQIRPSNLSGIPQPPILNTGNRGPIEHQPGDWICQKCNYLNWRRRKVCQTCYPYAEGNGDSISAAVQTERINLLTSLLAQNQLPMGATPPSLDIPGRNTATQASHQRPPESVMPSSRLSRSQVDLRTSQYLDSQYIYETSGPHRHGSHSFPNMRDLEDALPGDEPVPLLPSFLQDIVQSPTLSPTSTSSADLSVEEYEDNNTPSPRPGRDRVATRDDSVSNFALGNIWKLNDEETTNIAGIALPHHGDLVGSRKNSQEILRRQSP